ncbi:hypothetical protein M409DRAFT_57293 [Zasmidium cellare ATCC 36951]|uniref:F-box domain-containing protein n=1 Tax=Zasmidium cellare ATCC 36951 TaxID=1080233 RepID=A0A6A6CEG2_ZASCE|nr:uncharacterized protein M409DRAFT_57293 [Zasmidium cellare ATCC 36951]KAF2163816.1 hypothetical protein M409DRAFT_57293 [Zasmidium cellare ATCC 36951]
MAIEECPRSRFLELPQEVRDLIYSFAFDETLSPPPEYREFLDDKEVSPSPEPSVFGIDVKPSPFKTHYPSTPPRPAWYALLLCCRQTAADVREYFTSKSCHSDDTATLTLTLTSTTAKAFWTSLPTTTRNLQINLLVTHFFDAALLHPYPSPKDNIALHTIFNLLKRYLTRGPHLAHPSKLPEPTRPSLESVTIKVAPAWKEEDMAFMYGNPAEQLGVVKGVLRGWVEGFCASAAVLGGVGRVEVEGVGEWVVTGDVWDEEVVTPASFYDTFIDIYYFFLHGTTYTILTTLSTTPSNKPDHPSKMFTTPTSDVSDELIAAQQIKLKETQQTINDGFEAAYESLREWQNTMAVAKVEEAEANEKREAELDARGC